MSQILANSRKSRKFLDAKTSDIKVLSSKCETLDVNEDEVNVMTLTLDEASESDLICAAHHEKHDDDK